MNSYLRTFQNRETLIQFVKVGLVGVGNTVVTFTVFNVARIQLSLFWSLLIAFSAATVVSYVANRRWSFQLNDRGENLNETWRFFGINAVAWGITDRLMWATDAWLGLSRLGENLALLVISGMILVPKFAGYRDGVFGSALRAPADDTASVG